ncbi:MAG: hypothetical protein IPL28_22395 [Chloroflexi bacterium]|nr:hypothetical protein [Chloroflexota bacterium]
MEECCGEIGDNNGRLAKVGICLEELRGLGVAKYTRTPLPKQTTPRIDQFMTMKSIVIAQVNAKGEAFTRPW